MLGLRALSLRLIVISLGCLIVSGCSIKLAYNNVDRLVRWQVGEFVDLDREQKAYLNQAIEDIWVWHRRDHLPEYAAVVEKFAQQSADGVSVPALAGMFDQIFVWSLEVRDRAMPAAVHILKNLSDEQVAALPDKLADSNAEILKPEAKGELEDFQERWAEEVIDGLEQFAGRLQPAQKDYVQLQSRRYQPERALWVDYRERWQAQLLKDLALRHEDDFEARFTQLVADREHYFGETFVAVSEANEALGLSVASHILSNLNERQSERFQNRLLELAEDFRELSQRS